jgi:hypothetical protein
VGPKYDIVSAKDRPIECGETPNLMQHITIAIVAIAIATIAIAAIAIATVAIATIAIATI